MKPLRSMRESAGLSLREAAGKVGVHHQTLARYEDGEHQPKAAEISAMAAAYGVTVAAVVAASISSRPKGPEEA